MRKKAHFSSDVFSLSWFADFKVSLMIIPRKQSTLLKGMFVVLTNKRIKLVKISYMPLGRSILMKKRKKEETLIVEEINMSKQMKTVGSFIGSFVY